jgi:hypothetical protein
MLPLIAGAAGTALLGYGLHKTGVVSFHGEDSDFGWFDRVTSGISKEQDNLHNQIYNHVLENEKNPAKIAALGNAFKAAGRTKQGNILLKRANVGNLTKAQKAARKAVTARAFASHNPVAVDQVAKAFENEGCVGHAKSLREYSNALRQIITNVTKTAGK